MAKLGACGGVFFSAEVLKMCSIRTNVYSGGWYPVLKQ
jgi:hypothetical protein